MGDLNLRLRMQQKPSSAAPTAPLPSSHKETQPFLHAIQRSADGSSNSRETTQPFLLNHTTTSPLSHPARKSQPPTKPRRQAAHASRASLIRPTPPHKKRLRSHPIPGQPRSLHFYMYIYLTCSSMSVTTGFRINPSTHSAQNP